MVTIGGNSVMADPSDGDFVLEAYGIEDREPGYVREPAEYGSASVSTASTGRPELVMITPDGETSHPIRHG